MFPLLEQTQCGLESCSIGGPHFPVLDHRNRRFSLQGARDCNKQPLNSTHWKVSYPSSSSSSSSTSIFSSSFFPPCANSLRISLGVLRLSLTSSPDPHSIAHPIALLCRISGMIADRMQLNTLGNRFSSAASSVFILYRSLGLPLTFHSLAHPSKHAGQFSSMIGSFTVFANSRSCFSRTYTNGRMMRMSFSLFR